MKTTLTLAVLALSIHTTAHATPPNTPLMLAEVDIVEQRARAAERDHNFTDLAKQKTVAIGMEPRHVELAWGRPRDINRTIGNGYVHEQWVYGGGRYVYIDDGIVTSIQH